MSQSLKFWWMYCLFPVFESGWAITFQVSGSGERRTGCSINATVMYYWKQATIYAHPLLHCWCILKKMRLQAESFVWILVYLHRQAVFLFIRPASHLSALELVSLFTTETWTFSFSLRCLIQPVWGLISIFCPPVFWGLSYQKSKS